MIRRSMAADSITRTIGSRARQIVAFAAEHMVESGCGGKADRTVRTSDDGELPSVELGSVPTWEGSTMIATCTAKGHSQKPDALGPEPVLSLSTCPSCKHARVQQYNRIALNRLLDHGHPVEGYCAECDAYWRMTPQERADLAEELED
jgi:hypothetical protein